MRRLSPREPDKGEACPEGSRPIYGQMWEPPAVGTLNLAAGTLDFWVNGGWCP